MRQGRCLELLNGCVFYLSYYSGKSNIVADAMSKKSLHRSMLMARELELIEQSKEMI